MTMRSVWGSAQLGVYTLVQRRALQNTPIRINKCFFTAVPTKSSLPSRSDDRREIIVEDQNGIIQLMKYIEDAKVVGIDTEFISFPYYAPKLELVQISTPDVMAVVDYQKVKNHGLRQLHEAWKDKECIFHSGNYDLRIIGHLCGSLPNKVFDTQEAASFAGLGTMIGLKDVVEQCCGVTMDKSMTMSNWSLRPLSKEQFKYAMDDVRYLHETREVLIEKLSSLGRLDMFNDEMVAKSLPSTYAPPDPSELWQTVRRTRKFVGQELAILRELSELRDRIARENNKDPAVFMRDDHLTSLVHLAPKERNELYTIQGFSVKTANIFGSAILSAVKRGVDMDEKDWPVRTSSFDSAEEKDFLLYEMMNSWIKSYCKSELALGHDLVTTRKELMAIIVTPDKDLENLQDVRLMSGWRRKYFLEGILAIKKGEKFLKYDPVAEKIDLI
eukprot:CFRG1333T1